MKCTFFDKIHENNNTNRAIVNSDMRSPNNSSGDNPNGVVILQ